MINVSVSQGVFPKDLKIAKVILIYTAEDSHNFSTDRPIRLLHCFSNIKRCVAKQLNEYFNDYYIYHKNKLDLE